MAGLVIGAVGAVHPYLYVNNTVFGCASDVYGNSGTIIGACNMVYGDNNIVIGANNIVRGNNNVVIGNNITCIGDNKYMVGGRSTTSTIITDTPLTSDNLARLMIFREFPGIIPDTFTHICKYLHDTQITREQLLIDIRNNLRMYL